MPICWSLIRILTPTLHFRDEAQRGRVTFLGQSYQKELKAPYSTSRGKDPDLSALPPLPCCDHLWGKLRPRTQESRSSFLCLRTMISPQATTYSTEGFQLPVPVRWPMLQWQSIHSAWEIPTAELPNYQVREITDKGNMSFLGKSPNWMARRWGQVEAKFTGDTEANSIRT